MNIKQFGAACNIDSQREVERACLLAFFLSADRQEE